jgi:hypothetical protein
MLPLLAEDDAARILSVYLGSDAAARSMFTILPECDTAALLLNQGILLQLGLPSNQSVILLLGYRLIIGTVLQQVTI